MSTDQEKGLDGLMTDTDVKMLNYYHESLKFKSSHWFKLIYSIKSLILKLSYLILFIYEVGNNLLIDNKIFYIKS